MAATPRVPLEDQAVPLLDGWVGLTEAGEAIGVTRQQAHRLAQDNFWLTLRRVGKGKLYVVSTEEVEQKVKERQTTRRVVRQG